MLQGHFHISGDNCRNVSNVKKRIFVIFDKFCLLELACNKNKINRIFDEKKVIFHRGVRGLRQIILQGYYHISETAKMSQNSKKFKHVIFHKCIYFIKTCM